MFLSGTPFCNRLCRSLFNSIVLLECETQLVFSTNQQVEEGEHVALQRHLVLFELFLMVEQGSEIEANLCSV